MLEKLMELENKINRLSKGIQLPEKPAEIIPEIMPEVAKKIIIENKSDTVAEAYEECLPDFNIELTTGEQIPEQVTSALPSEPKNETLENSDLPNWEYIITLASKGADFGFVKIINSGEVSVNEKSISITFNNNSYLNIAKMNKYDSVIKKALSAITNDEYSVRLLSGNISEVKHDNNFQFLMDKLEQNSENISFFD